MTKVNTTEVLVSLIVCIRQTAETKIVEYTDFGKHFPTIADQGWELLITKDINAPEFYWSFVRITKNSSFATCNLSDGVQTWSSGP